MDSMTATTARKKNKSGFFNRGILIFIVDETYNTFGTHSSMGRRDNNGGYIVHSGLARL